MGWPCRPRLGKASRNGGGNPYIDSELVELLKACSESGKRVLNDLLRKQFTAEKPIEEVIRQGIREELKKAP